MPVSAPIKVLIAEEHFIIRQGLRQIISHVQTLQLSGEAENEEQMQQLIPILQPHVIVTGIYKPPAAGEETIIQLPADHPRINIIVFSNCAEATAITEITGAGAAGYVMKNCHGEEVVSAIEAVHNNKNYYCSNTLQVLKAAADLPRIPNANAYLQQPLTVREKEVMLLMCREKSCKEIGLILKLSRRTIEGHRQQVLRKTQSKSALGVLKYAVQNNLYVMKSES